MRRFKTSSFSRFGYTAPHTLNRTVGYRGGIRH